MRLFAFGRVSALSLSLLMASTVYAMPPTSGIIVEGTSIPGVPLGLTRAEVASVYGAPSRCTDLEVSGDAGRCAYSVGSEGALGLFYQGADGGVAANSPDDRLFEAEVFETFNGVLNWQTSAGLTIQAIEGSEAAIFAAYPNVEVSQAPNNPDKLIYTDTELGVAIGRNFDRVVGRFNGSIKIFVADGNVLPDPDPLPIPEPGQLIVDEIDLSFVDGRNRNRFTAVISLVDETSEPLSGAEVFATWTRANGRTRQVSAISDSDGEVIFRLKNRREGTYSIEVTDVILEGFALDTEASELSASVSTN